MRLLSLTIPLVVIVFASCRSPAPSPATLDKSVKKEEAETTAILTTRSFVTAVMSGDERTVRRLYAGDHDFTPATHTFGALVRAAERFDAAAHKRFPNAEELHHPTSGAIVGRPFNDRLL